MSVNSFFVMLSFRFYRRVGRSGDFVAYCMATLNSFLK
jgi:hypothetical protein